MSVTARLYRFPSPTRWNGMGKRHLAQSLQRTSSSKTHITCVNTSQDFLHTSPEYCKSCTRNVKTMSNSVISSSLKSANRLKNWQKLKDTVQPIVKTVSALNLELPRNATGKFISLCEKYSPTALRKSISATADDSNVENAKSSMFSEKIGDTKTETFEDTTQILVHQPSQTCQREQHDFEQAMHEMADSQICDYEREKFVKPYNSTISMPGRKQENSVSLISTDDDDNNSNSVEPKKHPPKAGMLTSVEPFVNRVREIIPSFKSADKTKVKKADSHTISRAAINARTRALVMSLMTTHSNMSRLNRLEELSKHLLEYPEGRSPAIKAKVTNHLLRLRHTKDKALSSQINETLALLGHVDPVKGKGIRLLTLDGGGTRGLIALEVLRKIEARSGKQIYELFDYIGGVSTGSLLAVFLAVYRLPLDHIEKIYREFSAELFQRNSLIGAGKLFLSHSYYDTVLWGKILRKNIGAEKTLIESARDTNCPKIFAISTLVNYAKLRNFMFRNYNLPPGVYSHFDGTCKFKLWEAIRASSAAPGYFEEFALDGDVHQDGGVLTNNPTAIGIHECKLLWPKEELQCIISIGNGRYEPTEQGDDPDAYYKSVKGKLTKIVQSATDTEAVHTMMSDLLPPSIYFRFNPYMTEEFQLDEIRPDKLDLMNYETKIYCRKNENKLKRACESLLRTRYFHQKAKDYVKLKIDTWQS